MNQGPNLPCEFSFSKFHVHPISTPRCFPQKRHITAAPKKKWTFQEDQLLCSTINQMGIKNWSSIAKNIPGRNGKQCRERWLTQLNPQLLKQEWSHDEDLQLIDLHNQYGNSWAKICQYFPGRNSSSLKNRWTWILRHFKDIREDTSKQDITLDAFITSTKEPQKYFITDPIWPISPFLEKSLFDNEEIQMDL